MSRDSLKNKIKDLAVQGCALRRRIQATKGPERYALWNEKRAIGWSARVALLAYGFLRGRPCRGIEPTTRNGPWNAAGLLASWQSELGESADAAWTQEDVKRWLEVPALPSVSTPEGRHAVGG